jgi:outer membrane receptor protein involved in Fe transport
VNSYFWQHNFYIGYRFPHRHAEIRLGLLNITDKDYRLNPITLYSELPRERTLEVSVKLEF